MKTGDVGWLGLAGRTESDGAGSRVRALDLPCVLFYLLLRFVCATSLSPFLPKLLAFQLGLGCICHL